MVFFSAALAGFSIACTSWAVLHYLQMKSTMANRLSEISGSFPYAIPDYEAKKGKKKGAISLDDSYEDKLTRQLFLAGVRDEEKKGFYRLLLTLSFIIPIAFFIFYGTLGLLTIHNLMIIGCLGPAIYGIMRMSIRSNLIKRQKSIENSLPQFFDLLVVCLEAGMNFSSALPRVVDEMDASEPLTQEFKIMHSELMGGLAMGEACDRLAKRCDVSDLSVILSSIVQSDQMGAGLAPVLRIQSAELRDKHRQRMRERAYRIPIKLLFPMVLIFATLFAITFGPTLFKLSDQLSGISDAGVQSLASRSPASQART